MTRKLAAILCFICLGAMLPPVPKKPVTVLRSPRDTATRTALVVRAVPRPPRPKPSISLTWDTPKGVLTAYRVYAGWSTDHWVTNWVVYPNVATNADGAVFTNVITITNLQPHPYVFAVAATNAQTGVQGLNSGPAWTQMNSNGTMWSNVFFWLAPSNRMSVVQSSPRVDTGWVTVFAVTPTNDAVFAVSGPKTNQWYFRRFVQ